MAVSRSDARWSAGRSAANVVSTRDTRRSKASCWASAIAIALSVVKSYWGWTAIAGRRARGLGLRRALELERLGRDDVARCEVTGRDLERFLRQDVRAEDGGQDQHQDGGRDPEARRIAARETGDRVDALRQHRSVRPVVVRGQVGLRERRGDHAADDLAVGTAAGPRRRASP